MCAKERNSDVSKYLYLRTDGRSQNWHVRLVAPTEIHHLLVPAKREIRRSTGTPDRKKAQSIGARIIAEYREQWQGLRAELCEPAHEDALKAVGLTSSLIDQIGGARLGSWAFTDDAARIDYEGLDDDELAELEAFCEMTDAAMRSVLSQGRRSSTWQSTVQTVLEWCEDLGYRVEVTDPLFPKLVRRFADAEKTSASLIRQRNAGEAVDFPSQEAELPRLSSMVDLYEKHKGGNVVRKVLTTNVSIWQRFVAFCGDIPLDSASSGHVYRFLESRLKTEDEPWSQGYATGRAKNTLKEFFGLARTMSLMSSANPVSGLETHPRLTAEQVEERKQPRHPFDAGHLNKLFSSDWYAPNPVHIKGRVREDYGIRYWGPLISLFHGLRVRELVQLHSHDLRVVDGILLMSIQLDLDDTASSDGVARSLKNASTKRTIPVHPMLITLGFADFVDTVRKQHAVGAPLFPSAVPDSDSKSPLWGRAYEQAFLRHVRERLSFGHGYGNHSFRHTVEDRIRDVQLEHGIWPAGLSQFYTGRKLPRDSDKVFLRLQGSEIDYGKGYKPANMVKFVQLISFDDVDLPPSFDVWLRSVNARGRKKNLKG